MRTPQMMIEGWFQSRRDHAADVLDRLGLPGLVADMLPAGDFLEDQQAELVAAIEEPRRLRVVRGAHDVDVQLVLQDLGVALLRGAAEARSRHRGRTGGG